MRVELGPLTAFYRERVPCPLPNAPTAAATTLAQQYETVAPGAASGGIAAHSEEVIG